MASGVRARADGTGRSLRRKADTERTQQGMVSIRGRLARLDETAGLTGNSLPRWLSLLVNGVLGALVVIGIVRGDREVILFAGLILGLFIGMQWRTNRR